VAKGGMLNVNGTKGMKVLTLLVTLTVTDWHVLLLQPVGL
jgi:hypothetical protein